MKLGAIFWPISCVLLLATTTSRRSLINQRQPGGRDLLPSNSLSFSGDLAIAISPATPSWRRMGALTIQTDSLSNSRGLKSET